MNKTCQCRLASPNSEPHKADKAASIKHASDISYGSVKDKLKAGTYENLRMQLLSISQQKVIPENEIVNEEMLILLYCMSKPHECINNRNAKCKLSSAQLSFICVIRHPQRSQWLIGMIYFMKHCTFTDCFIKYMKQRIFY